MTRLTITRNNNLVIIDKDDNHVVITDKRIERVVRELTADIERIFEEQIAHAHFRLSPTITTEQ